MDSAVGRSQQWCSPHASVVLRRNSRSGAQWRLAERLGNTVDLPRGRTLVAALPPDGVDPAVMSSWLADGCRGPAPTRLGFAALLWDQPRNTVVAASGFRRGVSWFAGTSPDVLTFGTLLPPVLDALGGGSLNSAALAEYCLAGTLRSRTVYDDVIRVPFGHVVEMSLAGQTGTGRVPAARRWFDVSPRSRVRGRSAAAETDAVLQSLRDAVTAGLPRHAPVAALMSGGLDSTTLAALAAPGLSGSGRSVAAYCHVAVAGTPDLNRRIAASDEPWARAVADSVPGIDLHVIDTPLQISPAATLRRLIALGRDAPLVPSNEAWLTDLITRVGRSSSGSYLLTGGAGNAAYSYGFNNPAALLTTGEWGGFAGWVLSRRAAGRSLASTAAALRRSISHRKIPSSPLSFLAAPLRSAATHVPHAGRASAELRRSEWLRRVGGTGWSSTWQSLDRTIWWDDPFTDPGYFATISALPTQTWLRSGDSRSLARRVSGRLLPAEVATRSGRGGQGEDLFARLRLHRESMAELIEDLREEPAAATFADVDRLQRAWDRVIDSRHVISGESVSPGMAAHSWARGAGRVLECAELARQHAQLGRQWR